MTQQDHAQEELQAHDRPDRRGQTGPVPAANRPGRQPPHQQDKPDREEFRRRFGGQDAADDQAEDPER